MAKAQVRCKRNFDNRLRRQRDDLTEGEQAFLRRDEPPKPGERSHKRLSVVIGPFPITKITDRTVVLRIGDNREEVSRD